MILPKSDVHPPLPIGLSTHAKGPIVEAVAAVISNIGRQHKGAAIDGRARGAGGAGVGMVRCVGKVERFGPKTKFEPLRKAKLAVQARIHVTECRAAQGYSARTCRSGPRPARRNRSCRTTDKCCPIPWPQLGNPRTGWRRSSSATRSKPSH